MKIRTCNAADGRLEIFVLNAQGVLKHLWQSGISKWDWRSVDMHNNLKDFCVTTHKDGHVEIWAIDNKGTLINNYHLSPNGSFSGWKPFGGFENCIKIDVAQHASKRLEVFVVLENGAVRNLYQDRPNSDWNEGQLPPYGVLFQDVCASKNADGRVEIFFISRDNKIFNMYQKVKDGDWWWGNFSQLNNEFVKLTVGFNADKRQELFAIGKDNILYHRWQLNPSGDWQPEWESMERYVRDFTVERHADGRIELFAIGEDYNICHIWQTVKNGTWSKWDVKLHTTGFTNVGAGKSQDGRIYIIALSENNSVLNIHENFIGGEWSQWSLLDFSYWMSEIYDDIKDRLVGDIAYPGSHDAGSYNFYTTPQNKPEQDIHHISPEGQLLINKRLVEKVRCVQLQSIGEQLRGGCRYFNLRVVRARNNSFYCQHEFVAESMSNLLSEIKEYLEEGERRKKRELLFLDVSVFCNNLVRTADPAYAPEDIVDFRRLVEDAIGKYMYFIPETNVKAPTNVQKQTYGSFFTDDKPSVIVSGIVYKDVGMGTFRGRIWPNSSDVKHIITFEKDNYNYYVATSLSNPADYYMTHFTSTIHLNDLIRGDSQLDLVKKINEQMWQLEDILFLSTTNGHLINVLYLDSPAYSPAAHYAYIMNNMITRQKKIS